MLNAECRMWIVIPKIRIHNSAFIIQNRTYAKTYTICIVTRFDHRFQG